MAIFDKSPFTRASFIVHPESGDKVTMGITTMVTMFVLFTMVIQRTPETEDSPLLSK